MLKTKEYYKILHFLKVESVDRIYPVEEYFYRINEETGEEEPIIYEGDSFLFETNRQQFSGLDYVEVLLESSQDFSTNDLKLNISEYKEGYDPVVILDAEPHDNTVADTPLRIVFKIRKSQTMSETSRNLTNIKSIELVTPNNVDFKIHEICFRDNNAPFTLEQLDAFYEDGKYYVLSRLHMEVVPPELEDHIYTASAGYGWMSVWEYEARVMNDEQKNAKSYGKWLFAVVDDAIDLYKKANGILDDDVKYVLTNLVTHRKVRW
ncbi:MAG: hypothetical protein J6Y78_04325 [Paludibacteraceae bacterium]|nr:hypothetical protein [Paludibacteraceae bacterium]